MDLNRIAWRKASYSTGNGGACIEVGTAPRSIAVRDSTDPEGPKLTFAAGSWQAFTSRVKNGADPA